MLKLWFNEVVIYKTDFKVIVEITFIYYYFLNVIIHSQKLKTMVKIINYKEREREDGTSFFTLELQGGLEMVQSQETGKFYATIRKTSIATTFDEATCKAVIGTEMPGAIIKQEVEPYTYVAKETGEQITLSHRWVYVQEPIKANVEAFSKNGVAELEPAF